MPFKRLALPLLAILPLPAFGQLQDLEDLLTTSPLPFVVVEGHGDSAKNSGQGVVVSEDGHVLSAGHLAWVDSEQTFTDRLKVIFRGSANELPEGVINVHSTKFIDREDAIYREHQYNAELIKKEGSRFLNKAELSLLKVASPGPFSPITFFSDKKPTLKLGETLTLCHYVFPDKPADPTFLMSPLKVTGIGRTSAGIQYLAEGFYRNGSSGAAILKDGKLIGIQSAAYAIKAQNGSEHPYGLVSFELVWGDMVDLKSTSKAD